MARIARVVSVGFPHHVVQRGNRRQPTFFCVDDYLAYLDLMREWCAKHRVEIWAYCLMPNHIHLIAVPLQEENSLRLAVGEAHRRYTRRVNFREGWRGHLWQERFHSFPMDENHLLAAARYIEQNPVRAELVVEPTTYRWSSAAAHVSGRDDCLVRVRPLLEMEPDWERFLNDKLSDETINNFRKHEQTGRPLGSDTFIKSLEKTKNRVLHPLKPWANRNEG